MSHNRLRQSNTCLNCGTEVPERYCPHCGQENIEPKENFWHLIVHFFSDVTHYDSKFFTTVKALVIKPGFLTKEYIAGRRAKYLNPIRAYLFVSFVFFLILFAQKHEDGIIDNSAEENTAVVKEQLADSLRKVIRSPVQVTAHDSLRRVVLQEIAQALAPEIQPAEKQETVQFALNQNGIKFTLVETRYKNLHEYDSVQQALSDTDSTKDKGIRKWVVRANVRLKNQYGKRSTVVLEENFNHSVPKIMFVLLPFFALLVMLFHSRKEYSYIQHAFFSIHYHLFAFLLFLLVMLLNWIFPEGWFSLVLSAISVLVLFFYLTIALKNTYQQSFPRSILKAFAIGILYGVTMIIGLLFLALVTFLTA